MSKRSSLFLLSIAVIALYFMLPLNTAWFQKRISPYIHNFSLEKDHLSVEERREYKYRDIYVLLSQMAVFLGKNSVPEPLVLLPPNSFLKAQHVNLRMPEPVVFYYYTGFKAVWTDSPNVDSANWAVVSKDGKINLVQLKNKQNVQQILSYYKNYPPAL